MPFAHGYRKLTLIEAGYKFNAYSVIDYLSWQVQKRTPSVDFLKAIYEINMSATIPSVVEVLCQLLTVNALERRPSHEAAYYLQPLFLALMDKMPHLEVFETIGNSIETKQLTDRQLETIFHQITFFIHVPEFISHTHPIFTLPLLRFLRRKGPQALLE